MNENVKQEEKKRKALKKDEENENTKTKNLTSRSAGDLYEFS